MRDDQLSKGICLKGEDRVGSHRTDFHFSSRAVPCGTHQRDVLWIIDDRRSGINEDLWRWRTLMSKRQSNGANHAVCKRQRDASLLSVCFQVSSDEGVCQYATTANTQRHPCSG